ACKGLYAPEGLPEGDDIASVRVLLERLARWLEGDRQAGGNAHAADFRSVRWNGEIFSFTLAQSKVVAALWGAWMQRTPEVGTVQPAKPSQKTRNFERQRAKASAAAEHQLEPDLQLVVDRWPELPAPIKAAILAMIRAS